MSTPVRLRRTLKVQPKIGPAATARASRPIEQTQDQSKKQAENTQQLQEEVKIVETQEIQETNLIKSTEENACELEKTEEIIQTESIIETQQEVTTNACIYSPPPPPPPEEEELKSFSPISKELEREDDRQSIVSNETATTSSASTSDSQFSILNRDPNYKFKFSLEHIQHVIKQKALQKLKESEKQVMINNFSIKFFAFIGLLQ
jgi:hypothetical protein